MAAVNNKPELLDCHFVIQNPFENNNIPSPKKKKKTNQNKTKLKKPKCYVLKIFNLLLKTAVLAPIFTGNKLYQDDPID